MSRLRIAQLTDLHLRHALPGSSRIYLRRSRVVTELFRKLVNSIVVEHRPDILLLTGDLLDVPFHAMHGNPLTAMGSPLSGAIVEDYRLIKDVLDQSGLRSIVIPGNHDDVPLMREVFGDMRYLESIADYDFLVFHHDREREDHFPLRDFSLYNAPPDARRPSVHVQHYVVTPALNKGYPHTYVNADEILSRNANPSGPLLSVSGHYHCGYGPIIESGCTYVVAGALCEPPYRWYLYELEDSRVAVESRSLASDPRYVEVTRPVSIARADELLARRPPNAGPWVATVDGDTSERECDAMWVELSRRGLDVQGVYPITGPAQRELLATTAGNGFSVDKGGR